MSTQRDAVSYAENSDSTSVPLLVRSLRVSLWLLRIVPHRWQVWVMGVLVQGSIGSLSDYHQKILENLDYVWPGMPRKVRLRIARKVANNVGRAIIEHLRMDHLDRQMKSVIPTGPGVPFLLKAVSESMPVVLVTGHFGNYEAARLCLLHQGCRLGALYRPMAKPALNQIYLESIVRKKEGPLFAQDRRGMVQLLRHLQSGGSLMILNDLYVGSGVDMDFLGRPAMTSLSAAELALRFKAPLIPFYGTRKEDGLSFSVELEEPIPRTTAEEMTQALNKSLEKRVLAHPEEWLWIHRRWKRRNDSDHIAVNELHPAALPRSKSNKLRSASRRAMALSPSNRRNSSP